MTVPATTRFTGRRRPADRPVKADPRVPQAAARLTEHYFRAMFDFGILSTAGADSFKHMLLGAAGGVVAFGLLLTYLYAGKYAMLAVGGSPERYRLAVLGDDLFIVGLPMLLAAFITLLVSDSLFPDERDFRILGPLPVRRTVVFAAKLRALILFEGLLIAVVHLSLLPLVLLTSVGRFAEQSLLSRLIVWAITGAGASLFAVLAITAIVGGATLALSRSRLRELTGIVRSAMLGLLVLAMPFVLRLPHFGGAFVTRSTWLWFVPPAWFVGLQRSLHGHEDMWSLQLAGTAIAAVASAAAVVATTYAILFRHFEQLVLRPIATATSSPEPNRTRLPIRTTPAFRAVHRFVLLTIRRSQLHQSVLVGILACGVGVFSPAGAAIWVPFGVMFVCALAVRGALVLPLEQRANWIFRLTEDGTTRREQLRAVDHVVTAFVVGLPVAASIPILWSAIGSRALVAGLVVALVGLVFVHAVLLDWRRIPFTCSYLPGKHFIAHSLLLGLFAYLVLTIIGAGLVRSATTGALPAVLIVVSLSLTAIFLRRRRLAAWSETPLLFEDELPDQRQQLWL